MNKTLTTNNTTGKATRRHGRYLFPYILAGVVMLIAWGLATSGPVSASGATPPQGSTGPAATKAEGEQPKQAQPPVGSDTTSGDYPHSPSGTACAHCDPAVAYGTNGEYLVVWQSVQGGAAGYAIYGQRVSSSGALLGSRVSISTGTGDQWEPDVAYNSISNEYLVVWRGNPSGTTAYIIYGQRVSSSGALLGENFHISTVPAGSAVEWQEEPDVAYNSASNEYLVVWADVRNGYSNLDVYGQRVSSSGALLGSEIPISTASGYQAYPAVAYNSISDEYLVVWDDARSGYSNANVYGQRVSSSGALLGSEFPISTASGAQDYPAVAYNSTDNQYLVVWEDERAGSSNEDIYGQRVSSSGALLGSNFPISTASGRQAQTEVAYNSTSNEYMVVWHDQRNGSSDFDIYGQRVSSSGVLLDSEFPISTASRVQAIPAVAYNSTSNEYLFVWYDERNGTETCTMGCSDIYGQRVSGSGALLGENFPISIDTTPCSIEFSDVPPGSTFHSFVKCLACKEILGGYPDGTFRPQNLISRGQIAKIVSNSAGYTDDVTGRQTYADVPSTQPFHVWIERLSMRGHMGGYNCGGAGEACDGANRPYFRPGNNASRGQLSKIVSNAAEIEDTPTGQTFEDVAPSSPFYLYIERLTSRGAISGYPCGGVGEPCGGDNRPYFRPSDNVTRGQASKIVANTFFPNCQTARP
jgi:hypothetical protein